MISSPMIKNNGIFYSENWRREEFRLMSISLPFFDIMIDGKYLYIIEMPKLKHSIKEDLILILLLGLGIIPCLILAASIVNRRKCKYYGHYRLSWLNANRELVSRNYEKHIFLKIPLESLKDGIVFAKNKFALVYDKKKITLVRKRSSLRLQKSTDDEFSRFKQLIKH